jgi:murein DD-endopeptidase MepM/ murein hydrolase activator NlpD
MSTVRQSERWGVEEAEDFVGARLKLRVDSTSSSMTPSGRAALLLSVLLALPGFGATRIVNRRIERNQILARALRDAGLEGGQADTVLSALEGVFDVRKSREGDQLRLVFREGELDYFDYRQSAVDEWQVRRDGDRMVASKRPVEVEKQVARVELEVGSSLYEAALAVREDPTLALALADVFAWDIDFYLDVRKGDRVACLVEKFTSKGRFLRYGEVLAADYRGLAVGHRRVFRYQLPDGDSSYFQEDGTSTRKAFLKSPLKFAHVTSGFGNRVHPVLQYLAAHQGVDYSAGVGTPVWAVADGVVTVAGDTGAGGNTVCLRHHNGLETCYLHLSLYGPGVRVGARVSQKQVIALSGNTGRTTGPHLHYALKRGGVFVNPLNQKFPRAEPVPPKLLADFHEKLAPMSSQLDAPSVAARSGPPPRPATLTPLPATLTPP